MVPFLFSLEDAASMFLNRSTEQVSTLPPSVWNEFWPSKEQRFWIRFTDGFFFAWLSCDLHLWMNIAVFKTTLVHQDVSVGHPFSVEQGHFGTYTMYQKTVRSRAICALTKILLLCRVGISTVCESETGLCTRAAVSQPAGGKPCCVGVWRKSMALQTMVLLLWQADGEEQPFWVKPSSWPPSTASFSYNLHGKTCNVRMLQCAAENAWENYQVYLFIIIQRWYFTDVINKNCI